MRRRGENTMQRVTTAQRLAAELLAEGHSQRRVAEMMGLAPGTVARWMRSDNFRALVDELTVATGIAAKAERLRIAKQVIRQKMRSEAWSKKDLLDWLKYTREETTEESPAVNINLLVANSFNSLPPEQRPAAYLELAKALFRGSAGPESVDLLSQLSSRNAVDLNSLLGGSDDGDNGPGE